MTVLTTIQEKPFFLLYPAVSEMQCRIYRPDLTNSQASRKKL